MTTFSVLMNGTVAADKALAYALLLARHLRRKQQPTAIRLLAVLPDATDPAAGWFPLPPRLTPPELTARLSQQAAALTAQVPCQLSFILRDVAAELARLLPAGAGEILVVGRPDEPADPTAHPLFFLCRLLPHPLLVVPAAFALPGEVPGRLLLDTDGGPVRLPPSARHAAELLLSLRPDTRVLYLGSGRRAAARLLAQLAPSAVGIHIYTDDEPPPTPAALLARFAEIGLLGELPHTLHTAYHPSVERGVLQLVQAYGADLLLLVARQCSLPGELFDASASAALMLRSPVPTLVVPEAAPVRWPRRA